VTLNEIIVQVDLVSEEPYLKVFQGTDLWWGHIWSTTSTPRFRSTPETQDILEQPKATKISRHFSVWHTRRGWESWACL